jgi:hypothetical protein
MYRTLTEAGERWADSKAAYQALDDSSKSILADLTQTYYEDGTKAGSRAAAETLALRSAQYRDHLAQVAAAHKAFLRAQVRYDSLRTLVELRRSEESTRRAEMRL